MTTLEAHLQRQIAHSRSFFWHRVRWKAVKRELRENAFTLTDVGAGIGLVGDYLARDFPSATYRFIEPLASLVAELEARFGSDANADGAPLFADSRYVTLLDVLEHIEDDQAFLAELTEKMTPGSTLIMTVPASMRLWSAWDVALGHHRRYDKTMLLRALEGAATTTAALRPRYVHYLFPEMLLPALIRRRARAVSRSVAAGNAEFPDLSAPMNALLYGVGSATLRLSRFWPAGTSLLVVADRI